MLIIKIDFKTYLFDIHIFLNLEEETFAVRREKHEWSKTHFLTDNIYNILVIAYTKLPR